jgi:hypothetical protein
LLICLAFILNLYVFFAFFKNSSNLPFIGIICWFVLLIWIFIFLFFIFYFDFCIYVIFYIWTLRCGSCVYENRLISTPKTLDFLGAMLRLSIAWVTYRYSQYVIIITLIIKWWKVNWDRVEIRNGLLVGIYIATE